MVDSTNINCQSATDQVNLANIATSLKQLEILVAKDKEDHDKLARLEEKQHALELGMRDLIKEFDEKVSLRLEKLEEKINKVKYEVGKYSVAAGMFISIMTGLILHFMK